MDFCLAVFPKKQNISIAEGRTLQWTSETRTFLLFSSNRCSWKKPLCFAILLPSLLITSCWPQPKDQYFLLEPLVPVTFQHTRTVVGIDNYLNRKFIVLQQLHNKHALFIKETVACSFPDCPSQKLVFGVDQGGLFLSSFIHFWYIKHYHLHDKESASPATPLLST